MSMTDRAAQFSPFAALTGYEEAVEETARMVDQRIELDDEQKKAIDAVLRNAVGKKVNVIHFIPDKRKRGGRYEKTHGTVKKVDIYECLLIMESDRICFDDIYSIELSETSTS